MPLLDHFHPPLAPIRHWESFHARWATSLADSLNPQLPDRYFAEPQTHAGTRVEIDVATFENPPAAAPASSPRDGNVGVLPPFAAAAQQNDDALAFAPVIHAVARPKIQPQLEHAVAQRLGRAEIARFQPPDVSVHPRRCHRVQSVEPFGERGAPGFGIFPNLKSAVDIVAFVLPLSTVVAGQCTSLRVSASRRMTFFADFAGFTANHFAASAFVASPL